MSAGRQPNDPRAGRHQASRDEGRLERIGLKAPKPVLLVDTGLHAAADIQRDAPGFVEARPVCDNDGRKARVLARFPAMYADVEVVIDQ